MKIEEIEQFIKKNNVSGIVVIIFFTIVTFLLAVLISLTPQLPDVSIIVISSFILIVAPFYNRLVFYTMLIIFTFVSFIFFDTNSPDYIPTLVRLFTFNIFLLIVGEGFISLSESRSSTQKALADKTSLLEIIIYFVQKAVDDKNIFDELPYVMKKVGELTNVAKVSIFEVEQDSRGSYMSQKYVWPNTEHDEDLKEMQKLYFADLHLENWAILLKDDRIIKGNVANLKDLEKTYFKKDKIKAYIIVPIFVEEKLWGFIELDDDKTERIWENNFVDVLRLFSNILGSTITLNITTQKLIDHTKEVEDTNKLMINRELRILELKERIKSLEKKK